MERAGQPTLFDDAVNSRLAYFVEGVLASAPQWNGAPKAHDICRIAAEIAELLSARTQPERISARRFRLRAALLYELADYPAIASAVLEKADYSEPLQNLVERQGAFRQLYPIREWPGVSVGEPSGTSFVEAALYSDVRSVMRFQQGMASALVQRGSELLVALSKELSIGYSASEMVAWEAVISRHAAAAVTRYVPTDLVDSLREMRFPSELWSSQAAAIQGGLLNPKFDTWGLAAPTGTGKSFITRLLIAETLKHNTDSIVLYLVPSRALVYEVSSNLAAALKPLEYEVTAVTPQLVALDTGESEVISLSSVLVLTPEKADLLLRLGNDILSRVSLIVIDEAHHIESSTRGVLLEMYLWRIRRRLQKQARFVFLSAVAPNIDEVVGWVGSNPGSVVIEQRATRMRVGVYKVRGTGKKASGTIEYSDGTVLPLISSGADRGIGRGIVQLAANVVNSGPVLVVAKGKRECERLAKLMNEWISENDLEHNLSDHDAHGETVQRLDARLEREMYPEVTLRTLVAHRIAYHHAGLPPSVRNGLEDAIRKGLVDFVFATTTLAEGVNFPFSTVIVQSLALREPPEKGRPARYNPVTPRVFWNIAGRAGRPGHDREGQVILFEPSLGLAGC